MRSVLTRLAVKLATQPDSNSRRTFAMSTFFDRIGRPTARISFTGDLANASTTSRSWIIRSRMTSTSSERGVKTLSRWTSKNIGWVSSGSVARTAGLKRSKMAGLRDAAVLPRQFDQLVGFGDASCQRLLDQNIDAALHQLAGDFTMRNGWYRDRCGLHAGRDQLIERTKCLRAELRRYGLSAGIVKVGNPDELNILRWVGLQVAIHARVIAAEKLRAPATPTRRASLRLDIL